MGGFELLEHTADVGVVATGETLADALSSLAEGMFSVIADLDLIEPCDSFRVEVDSEDQEALAVDWLNELLYTYESNGLLPKHFDVSVDEGGGSLTAKCRGESVDPKRHRMRTAVKAATYHGLEVSHDAQWRIQIVLDV